MALSQPRGSTGGSRAKPRNGVVGTAALSRNGGTLSTGALSRNGEMGTTAIARPGADTLTNTYNVPGNVSLSPQVTAQIQALLPGILAGAPTDAHLNAHAATPGGGQHQGAVTDAYITAQLIKAGVPLQAGQHVLPNGQVRQDPSFWDKYGTMILSMAGVAGGGLLAGALVPGLAGAADAAAASPWAVGPTTAANFIDPALGPTTAASMAGTDAALAAPAAISSGLAPGTMADVAGIGAAAGPAAGAAPVAGAAGAAAPAAAHSGLTSLLANPWTSLISAGVGAAANIYGVNKQADATTAAAQAQAQAARDTLAFEIQQANQAQANFLATQNANYGQYVARQENLQPFHTIGVDALNTMGYLLGTPVNAPTDLNIPANPFANANTGAAFQPITMPGSGMVQPRRLAGPPATVAPPVAAPPPVPLQAPVVRPLALPAYMSSMGALL